MLVLETRVHETIWGGEKLTPYSKSACRKIGHLYSVDCNEKESHVILNGPYKGDTFNHYFTENKARFHLEQFEFFPLVIALVEASDNLSIQVHPDDECSPVLNPKIKLGKSESWFFIDPPSEGSIYCGCLCKTMDELKHSIASGNMEAVTDRLPIEKNDYVYIKAGTLHAMSRGSLVHEIEENAGCTYRFYDFDRIDKDGNKRPLQIPEAFFSIHLENKSVTGKYGELPIEERRYITQHFESVSTYRNTSSTLQVFTVLNGVCEVDGIAVTKGMSIVLEPGEELHIAPVEAMVAEPKRLD